MKKASLITTVMLFGILSLWAREYNLNESESVSLNGIDEILFVIEGPNCIGCFNSFDIDSLIGGGGSRNTLDLSLEGKISSNKSKAVPSLIVEKNGRTLQVSLYPGRVTVMGLVSRGLVSFLAMIPDDFPGELTVRTSSDDLTVESLEGLDALDVYSSSGDLDIRDISVVNSMSIETSSGDQELRGLSAGGSATVNSSSGDVFFTELTSLSAMSLDLSSGDLDGDTLSGGDIRIKSSSGRIDIKEIIAGEYETARGKVDINSSSGDMNLGEVFCEEGEFDSNSGEINIDGLSGRAVLDSSSGDVDVVLMNLDNNVDFDVSSGKIDIVVPRDSSYSVDLRTGSGRIRSDHTIIGVVNDDNDEVVGDVNGGGALIKAHASSGNITITSK